eukprot:1449127-Heterocapsa_arctica.AAC.1
MSFTYIALPSLVASGSTGLLTASAAAWPGEKFSRADQHGLAALRACLPHTHWSRRLRLYLLRFSACIFTSECHLSRLR